MRKLRHLLRHRPALIILITLITVLIIGVSGSIISGPLFVVQPLPVPKFWAGIFLTVNAALGLVALCLVYRNLHRFEKLRTWQERGFSRGAFLVVFAGFLGSLARAFTEPTVSLGTPVYLIGILFIIWASIRSPERFEN